MRISRACRGVADTTNWYRVRLEERGALVTVVCLHDGFGIDMLRTGDNSQSAMIRLTNLEKPWRKRACAVLVLLAVCSIAIFVATRYCFSHNSFSSSATVHKYSSIETTRQRMTKTTYDWVPPTGPSLVWQSPTLYARIAPAGPAKHRSFFEKSLSNRPPPSC